MTLSAANPSINCSQIFFPYSVALRVPTITGSIVDLTVEVRKHTTLEEVDAAFRKAANETLAYVSDPIDSSDVIGSLYGSMYDANTTQIVNYGDRQLVKVMGWYDNEMASYVNMLGDRTVSIAEAMH